MTYVFWISCAVVLYTYAGYPLIMAVLAKTRSKGWRREPVSTTVSIVMAVHNGASVLPAKIAHLLEIEPETVKEIVIVSDGSNDATPEILLAQTDPRILAVVLAEQVGKSSAVNRGVAIATGEILLFVDIRPRVEEGALTALLSNFADPAVGCVAGELIVRCDDSHDAAASAVGGLYWRYEQAIRNFEAAWDSPVGVYGGFYAIRRSLAVPAPDGLILDDMFQPLSIIRQGYRSVLDRSAVVLDTWPAKTSGEFQRKVRTLAGNFQLLALAPWTLTPQNRVLLQFISHKLLRLVVPYALVLMLASAWAMASDSMFWFPCAAVQTVFWLLAALALRVRIPLLHRFAAPASALLVLNVAAVVGLYTFLFTPGPLWKIWAPTALAQNHLSLWEKRKQA